MPKPKNLINQIAKSRMEYLFNLAHDIFPKNKYLANRYVYLARRYAERTQTKISPKWKRRICHNCKTFLYPGINARYRLQSRKGKGSHVSMTCLECNHTTRYLIKMKRVTKQKSRRKN